MNMNTIVGQGNSWTSNFFFVHYKVFNAHLTLLQCKTIIKKCMVNKEKITFPSVSLALV